MFRNPLRVFRVFFETEHRPHHAAEFELVALPFNDARAVRTALCRGFELRGTRLIGWPAPGAPNVRLIDMTRSVELTKATVRDVHASALICAFRTSEDAVASESVEGAA